MKKSLLAQGTGAFVMTSLILFSSCSSKKEVKEKTIEVTETYTLPSTQTGVLKVTESWPEASKSAVNQLLSKYGPPSSISDDMVIWNNTPPFKKSIVYKEQTHQEFPRPHSDVLQQFIDYKVPKNKVNALAEFDGSLLVDRTKGELSTRNDQEEMNILVLNLADKIIKGEMSSEEARREYLTQTEAFMGGRVTPLVTELKFSLQKNTADPDVMMESQKTSPESWKKEKMKMKKDHRGMKSKWRKEEKEKEEEEPEDEIEEEE